MIWFDMKWGEKLKKSNVNKEAEAIEFLQSIGYRFHSKEKQFFPSKEEITETYPLDFLKERLAYNDMLLQEPVEKRYYWYILSLSLQRSQHHEKHDPGKRRR